MPEPKSHNKGENPRHLTLRPRRVKPGLPRAVPQAKEKALSPELQGHPMSKTSPFWLLRATAVIGGMTLISRFAGLARETLMANVMGAGLLTDVFNVAFRLPNFLRRIFAEGAFNAAFVPMFSGLLATEGKDVALDFASRVQALLAAVLIGLTLVVIATMPWVMYLYAPGFHATPEKFDLAVHLTRITFGYLLFIALTSLLSGLLNSADKYASAAFAPTLLNLMMIGGLLIANHFQTPAHALAWSVIGAGFVQWAWLLISAKRHGLLPKFVRPQLSPDVIKMLKIMAPVALGAGVAQVNLMIDTILASLLPTGAISYLSYADRLNQLPLGVIGVGVGTALLPMLSRQFKEGRSEEAHANLNRAIEFTMLLAFPACMALFCIGYPVIRGIYQHGAFTLTDALATSHTLMAFALGLPAFILIKVFAPGFFANQDTKTPFRIAIGCMALNTVLNLIFMWHFAQTGMALSTSLAGWVNALLMAWMLRKRGHLKPDALLGYRLPRLILAAMLMALALLLTERALAGPLAFLNTHALVALALLVGVGLASYALACMSLRLMKLSEFKAMLKRKPSTVLPPAEL